MADEAQDIADEQTENVEHAEGEENINADEEHDEASYESLSEEGEEDIEKKDAAFIEETWGEAFGEGEEGEEEEGGEKAKAPVEEEEEEEEVYEEEPPDPTAPYDLTDEKEAQRAPFKLNEEQMQEVDDVWARFQDYTPAYTDIKEYVTAKELDYMLRSLNLHTHTPEQLQELIDFCQRPPNEFNYVYYDAFVWMVTIRQRDMPVEEELRLALEILDPEHTGIIDREFFREVLNSHGKPVKTTEVLIKEVDMANDGTLGLEDIVGTICIDLNRDDIIMLYNKIYPPEVEDTANIDELTATGGGQC